MLTTFIDPIQVEIEAFCAQNRETLKQGRFDDLEKAAAELRAGKPLFGDGSWKIAKFYKSFECASGDPESVWETRASIHQKWIAAKPKSIAARVAYGNFLTKYAWQARGSGFANTITDQGGRLFRERLASARQVLREARALREKDPFWWSVALNVALGQGWPKPAVDSLLTEAHGFEPKFWAYDAARAYSLLPRWYGKPGDWEAFAAEAATRPDGVGTEVYARIVIQFRGFYGSVLRETKASWETTRKGLELMRERYPNSLEIVGFTAALATEAEDHRLAKEMYDRLGDTYLPTVWASQQGFLRNRAWADKSAQTFGPMHQAAR